MRISFTTYPEMTGYLRERIGQEVEMTLRTPNGDALLIVVPEKWRAEIYQREIDGGLEHIGTITYQFNSVIGPIEPPAGRARGVAGRGE